MVSEGRVRPAKASRSMGIVLGASTPDRQEAMSAAVAFWPGTCRVPVRGRAWHTLADGPGAPGRSTARIISVHGCGLRIYQRIVRPWRVRFCRPASHQRLANVGLVRCGSGGASRSPSYATCWRGAESTRSALHLLDLATSPALERGKPGHRRYSGSWPPKATCQGIPRPSTSCRNLAHVRER